MRAARSGADFLETVMTPHRRLTQVPVLDATRAGGLAFSNGLRIRIGNG